MSLVELLVAMVIMLIVIAAVLAVYTSSRQTVRTQSGINRMNERINLIAESVARDIRQAGFAGCPAITNGLRSARSDSLTSAIPTTTPVFANRALLFRVFTDTDPVANVHVLATKGSPIIELRMAAEQGSHLATEMQSAFSDATPIELLSQPGLAAGVQAPGTRVLISDCKDVQEVEVAEVTKQASIWKLTTVKPLIAPMTTDARVTPIVVVQYFAGLYTPPNGRTTRAIYRRSTVPGGAAGWNDPVPIVFDVTSMTVNLGLDTDDNWDSDQVVAWNAVADPNQIVAIQVNYTLNEGETGGLDSNRGTGVNGSAIQRSFSPWISVRGRII
jgi:type IV pilus assembly protein PilW